MKKEYIEKYIKNCKENNILNDNFIKYIKNLNFDEIDKINTNLLDNNVINSENLYDIIKLNNVKIIKKLYKKFKNYDEITIIGKGPTATFVENGIGINHSLILTNQEFLFINDINSLFGIEDNLKNVKFIFFPNYPHYCYFDDEVSEFKGGCPDKNLTLNVVINYLKKFNFTGDIFIYQIQTSYKRFEFFNFRSLTTLDIPISIFSKFLFIKKFKTYGFRNGHGYSELFQSLSFINPNDNEYKDLLLFNINNKIFVKYYNSMKNFYNKNKYTKKIIKSNYKKYHFKYIKYNHIIHIY